MDIAGDLIDSKRLSIKLVDRLSDSFFYVSIPKLNAAGTLHLLGAQGFGILRLVGSRIDEVDWPIECNR